MDNGDAAGLPEDEAQSLRSRIDDLEASAIAQRKLVAALQDSEERFRSLIDCLQVGVVVQTARSEIVVCNPKALELLGLTEEQMLGKTSFDPSWNVIHEDGTPFPGETHPVPQAIATRQPVRDVVMGVFRPARGDRVWILVSAMPQIAADGSVKQVVCTFTDITARRQAEQMVREQAATLQQISMPLIPISDDVVVMPLVGLLTPRRAEQVMETLLDGITGRGARVAILDVTGVSTMDTQVADGLLRAARAVRLLGAQMILTGLRPGVAQTLIGLGVDFTGILTLGTLQSGIAYALKTR